MSDLPEPKRPKLTPQAESERRWNLLVFSFTVATAYTVLHKLLIPLALKGTALATTPYASIDWWFLHSMLLLTLLRRSGKLNPIISFLAGMGIAYGFYEVYETALGRNPGWLAFSRLLSSLPIAGLCIAMMSSRQMGRRLAYGWGGALYVAAVTFAASHLPQRASIKQTAPPEVVTQPTDTPSHQECGAATLTVFPAEFETLAEGHEIIVDNCGIRPVRFRRWLGDLWLSNVTSEPVNLHLVTHERGRLRTLWNVLVPANQKLKSPGIPLREGSVAMLFSDNRLGAGILGLSIGVPKGKWFLSRTPLKMEQVP